VAEGPAEGGTVEDVAVGGVAIRAATPEAPLSLQLHRERGGPSIGVEPVTTRDLVDPLAELWFDADLRRGRTATPLYDVRAGVRIVERDDEEIGCYVAGFELRRDDVARYFARECLDYVAARGAQRLVREGVLEAGEMYYFGLAEGPEPDALVAGPEGRGAPGFASRKLRDLQAGADAVDVSEADDGYPVFFTRSARERAEKISRKGGCVEPPIETGCLLIGELGSCPDTHEVFAIVSHVIEATDAEATTYSLTYSGPTWARIQAVLKAQQSQPATRNHRVLGQAHGHSFLPFAGAEPCEACELVPVCTRSSAHLSGDDRAWCRAVFSSEPWAVSQVFGLDARGGTTEMFYGQRGGALERRGYYVIDDLDELRVD
jgi:hypothetical protein